MAVLDIFSKRNASPGPGDPLPVCQHDVLPEAFRHQVVHLWKSAIGHGRRYTNVPPPLARRRSLQRTVWDDFQEALAREYGRPFIGEHPEDTGFQQCRHFLLTGSTDEALDVIELTMTFAEERGSTAPDGLAWPGASQHASDAVDELNIRFREQGIGYRYESGKILRVDSEYVHAEMTHPASLLLADPRFAGAQQEFLTAHKHYRHQRYKEAIVEAAKAFESTMKSVCDAKGWTYPGTATAKQLIETLFDHGFLPDYLQSHFGALRSALESGVPTIRNKTSGHGQGSQIVAVPDYLAAYVLHLTAANIVMLARVLKADG